VAFCPPVLVTAVVKVAVALGTLTLVLPLAAEPIECLVESSWDRFDLWDDADPRAAVDFVVLGVAFVGAIDCGACGTAFCARRRRSSSVHNATRSERPR
jgi:hypothetical protein